MLCPRCKADLAPDRATWTCPQGHGRFVPAQSLRQAAMRRLAAAEVTFPSIACPGCGNGMHLYHPKRIDVDVCGCGSVWLDAGEEKALRERHPENLMGIVDLLGWIALGASSLG